MKNCSFFIVTSVLLTACAVQHSSAPIEYNHSNSKLRDTAGKSSEETIPIITPDAEIISRSNDQLIEEQQQEQQPQYIEEEDDTYYVMPEKPPVAKSPVADNSKIINHEVQAGETIEAIAAKYGQTIESIAMLNDLYPPYYLDEFQVLRIKTDKNVKLQKPAPKNISPETPALPVEKMAQDFIKPVDGSIIRKFGENTDLGINKGINIAASLGTEVKASAAGKVIYSDYDATFGNLVMVKVTNKNIITAYAHLKEAGLAKGAEVKQGDLIGFVGSTGKVGGKPQLHFAIREGKNAIDPLKYIEKQK